MAVSGCTSLHLVSTQKAEVDGECPQALSYPRGRVSRAMVHAGKSILPFSAALAGLALAIAVINSQKDKEKQVLKREEVRLEEGKFEYLNAYKRNGKGLI